jgi:hypothetical protein
MMSFVGAGGGYINGGSTSSSSNLSALASPFMVERSSVQKPNSNPLVDLTEPQFVPPLNSSLHNWLGFDSMSVPGSSPYSAAHQYSTTTDIYPYGQSSSEGITSNKLAEVKPYYLYVSSTIHDDGSLTDLHQAGYDLLSTTAFSGSSLRDEYTQGLSNSKQSGGWGGSWEPNWDIGQKKFEGNFVAKDVNAAGSSIYNDYLNQGLHASKGLSSFEEAAPSNGLLSLEKHGTSIMGSTSLLSEAYPQEPSQTVDNFRTWEKPNNDSREKRFRQSENNPNDGSTLAMKSTPTLGIRTLTSGSKFPVLNPSGLFKDLNIGSDASANKDSQEKIRFDASQLCFDLKQNEHMSTLEQPLEQNKDPSSSNKETRKDVLDNFSNGKFGLQVPNVSRSDGFNLSFEARGVSSESLDSPCWRGASVPYFSPFAASEAVYNPQLSKKPEACRDVNFQPFPLRDAVKDSSPKPRENSLYHQSGHLENGLAPSPKRPALGNVFDTKVGLSYKKPGNDHESQSSCEVGELKNKHALLTRSINESSFIKASQATQQTPEEVMLALEKKWSTGTVDAYIEMIVDDVSEGGSSDLPIQAAEQVLCSPSSVEGSNHAAKLLKSRVEESTPSKYVQTLLSSIHNLSELLMFHCSNETSKLKEEDGEVLKTVIGNLEKCVNTERATSTQKSIFPLQATSHVLKDSSVCQGVDEEIQVAKVASLNMSHLPNSQLFQAEKKHYVEPAKKEQESSECVHGSEDMVKCDQMTQDVKKILTENLDDEEEIQPEAQLYKNLWLEAEAALCLISYMARFNRMKSEIEKCKSHKMEEMSKNVKKLSTAKFSPDSELTPERNGGSSSDTNVQNSSCIAVSEDTDLSKISHPDDIMSRLNILKCRVDSSNSQDPVNVESLSISKVNKFPPSGANDVEASIMGRFHILKNRADSSSPMNQRSPGISKQESVLKDDMFSNMNVESVFNHDVGENSTVKEFHVCSKDDPVIQFNHSRRLGDPLPVGWNDSSPSDWEHVLKDELAGQNC